MRAHWGRRDEDRREDRGTGGQEGEGIWAHFHAFERIWDGEMGTGVMREGQGDKRGRAFGRILMLEGAFGTERGVTGRRKEGHGDRRGNAFGGIFMLSSAFGTER